MKLEKRRAKSHQRGSDLTWLARNRTELLTVPPWDMRREPAAGESAWTGPIRGAIGGDLAPRAGIFLTRERSAIRFIGAGGGGI